MATPWPHIYGTRIPYFGQSTHANTTSHGCGCSTGCGQKIPNTSVLLQLGFTEEGGGGGSGVLVWQRIGSQIAAAKLSAKKAMKRQDIRCYKVIKDAFS